MSLEKILAMKSNSELNDIMNNGIGGNSASNDMKPIVIEQFAKTWYGRGQLTSEPSGNSYTTNITATNTAGQSLITVQDASHFVAGSIVAVKHKNGLHGTYFIQSISTNTLTITPRLKYDVDNTCICERAWYNNAHPGILALNYIAEQIANATCDEYGNGKKLFELNFENSSQYLAIGTATIGTNSASSFNTAYGNTVNTVSNLGGYSVTSSANNGLKTKDFSVASGSRVTIRGWHKLGGSGTCTLKVVGGTTTLLTAVLPTEYVFSKNVFSVWIPDGITSIHLEFLQTDATAVTTYLDDWNVYEEVQTSKDGYLIPRNSKVVMLFDSWGTTQSGQLATKLAQLMPKATIINKGVGGNTATDMLARFDTDVTPNAPDIVLCDTGVNDVYMGAVDVNAYITNITAIVSKCISIGAKPIFLGIPALSEADLSYTVFQLNDKARIFAAAERRNFETLSPLTVSSGSGTVAVNQYDVTIDCVALANGSTKTICIGTVPAGGIINVVGAGGYLLASNIQLQVGFSDSLNQAFNGTSFNKTTSLFEKPNFQITNPQGYANCILVRVSNTSGSAYTGSAFASIQI